MVRERTFLNLAIGLVLSLLLHASLVIWGPALSLPVPTLYRPTEIEVDVREWPAPPVESPPAEPTKSAESPPPARPAQPEIPPNTVVLQEAVRTTLMPVQPEPAEVRLPEPPLPLPPPAPAADPVRVAQALLESLRTELPLVAPAANPSLPDPERRWAERRELPPLPTLERAPRQDLAAPRPATMILPSPDPALHIKGPAAERQVIFQPPPPTATVESETDIELRFWILPNGTVSRVVPLKKSDPRLEALATNYLRQWRFNPLPREAEQDEQWGIIPFKFRIR
jgi:TonB family protein